MISSIHYMLHEALHSRIKIDQPPLSSLFVFLMS